MIDPVEKRIARLVAKKHLRLTAAEKTVAVYEESLEEARQQVPIARMAYRRAQAQWTVHRVALDFFRITDITPEALFGRTHAYTHILDLVMWVTHEMTDLSQQTIAQVTGRSGPSTVSMAIKRVKHRIAQKDPQTLALLQDFFDLERPW